MAKDMETPPDVAPVPADNARDFLDRVNEIGGTPPPAPEAGVAPADQNAADFMDRVNAISSEMPPNDSMALRQSQIIAAPIAPDKAAKVARLASQNDIPRTAAQANFEQLQARAEADKYARAHIEEQHQYLTQWLKDPYNAAMAKGDSAELIRLSEAAQDLSRPPLPWWEAIIGGAQKSAKGGFERLIAGPALIQQEMRDLLGITGAPTTGTPLAEFYRAHDSKLEIERAESGYKSTLPQRALSGLVGMAADPTNLLTMGGAGAAVQGGKLVLTALERQSASPIMRLLSATTASHAEAAGAGFAAQAGGSALINAAEQARTAEPGTGPSAVDTAANVMAQAAIGYLGGRYLSFFRDPAAALTARTALTDILGQTALGTGLAVAGTTAETVTQEHRAPTGAELTESAVTGGIGGFALAGVTNAMEAITVRHHVENLRAVAQVRTAAMMDTAMKEVAASKTAELSPEGIEQLLNGIAERNGLGNGTVFMQARDFAAHFEANGKDPAIEAQRMGLGDEFAKAKALNTEVQLPVGAALRMGLDEAKAPNLATKFKQDPSLPTTEAAEQRIKDQPKLEKELADREKAFIEKMREPPTPEGADYIKRFREQALASGESPEVAESNAKILEAFHTRQAQLQNAENARLGVPLVTAQQMAAQFPLQIRSAVTSLAERATASGEMAKFFKKLREEGPRTPAENLARDELKKIGLDPLTMTDEQLHEALKQHLAGMNEGAKLEQARKVPMAGYGKDALIWRFRKAVGDRTPYEGSRAWDKLVEEQDARDAGMVLPEDPLAMAEHQAPSISERLADLKQEWMDEHDGKAPEEGDEEWRKQVANAIAEDIGKGKYFQTEGAGRSEAERTARGTFQIGANRESLITLYQSNRSTLTHELYHYMFTVMGDLAMREGASPQLRADYQKALEWSGYETHENMLKMMAQLDEVYKEIGNGVPTEGQRALIEHLAEPHEKLARGGERYLMTGIAPSKSLRRVFAKIQGWMNHIYRELKNLGVPMPDDITAVYDRMLASEDEIAAARERVEDRLAFDTREEAGASQEEWNSYHQLAQDAQRQEQDALTRSLMAVQRKAESEVYHAEKEAARKRFSEQVGKEPVYNAMSVLQDGVTWDGRRAPDPRDGSVMKIRTADAKELLTPEEYAKLPGPAKEGAAKANRGRSVTSSDGISANEAAEMLGYGHDGGQQLLQDLAAAPDRAQRVNELTESHMQAKYPDALKDPVALEDEANQALHASQTRARLLELEANLLERKAATDAADRAEAQAAKREDKIVAQRGAAAQQIELATTRAEIARMSSKDRLTAIQTAAKDEIGNAPIASLNPDKYTAAERECAKEFKRAMAAKDYATALDWKHKQLVNSELAREANKAITSTTRDRIKLHKAATDMDWRQTVAKHGGRDWTVTKPDGTREVFTETDRTGTSAHEQARRLAINEGGTLTQSSPHLDQIDQILEGAGLKRPTQPAVPRETLAAFKDRQEYDTDPSGQRYRNGITAEIPARFVQGDRPITYSKMSVNQLRETRAAVDAIESMSNQRNWLATHDGQTGILPVINELTKTALANKFKKTTGPYRGSGPIQRMVAGTNEFLGILEMMPRIAHEMDGFKEGGAWTEHFIAAAQRAADAKHVMLTPQLAEARAAVKEWGKMQTMAAQRSRPVPGTNYRFSLLEKIDLLMHWGNNEGAERLNNNAKLSDDQIKSILSDLDAKDIKFANRLVAIEGAHWSDIVAIEERYNGSAPPKVNAIPRQLPAGEFDGGYHRLYYKGSSQTSLQGYLDGTMGGDGYRRVVTNQGYTNERQETIDPSKVLDINFKNLVRSINETAHDLTHRDLVVNQAKLLSDPMVRAAITQTRGEDELQQFHHYLNALAASDKPGMLGIERGLNYMRLSGNTGARAFNPIFAAAHASGFVNAMVKVGPLRVGSAMLQMGPLGPWSKTAQWIRDSSVNMRSRYENLYEGLEPHLPGLEIASKIGQTIGLSAVHKLWEYTELTTWKGAYDKHLATGADHDASVLAADRAVNSTFGGQRPMDQPEIHRKATLWWKIIANSMSYDNAFLNQVITNVNRARRGIATGDMSMVIKGAASAAVLSAGTALVWDLISDTARGKGEEWTTLKGIGEKVALAPAENLVRSVPFLRMIGPEIFVEDQRDRFPGAAFAYAIADAFNEIHKAAPKTDRARSKGERVGRALIRAAADFLPVPSTQIIHTWDGAEYNSTHNEDLLHQFWRLASGPPLKSK